MRKKTAAGFRSIILVLLLLLGAFIVIPTQIVSADQAGDYTYTVSGGFATITGYTGLGGAITIPSTLGGYTVVAIGDGAFWDCGNLTSVIIPGSVTTIGNAAFGYCSLTSVILPGSVTTFGGSTFSDCYSLTNVTILDGATTVGNGEFINCYSLISVTIPSSVSSIGYNAFFQCTSLTSITLPAGVTSIGERAFLSCRALTSMTIPDKLTSIEAYTFLDCMALTSMTIPDNVTSIGNYAFQGCTALTSVTIGSGVTSIEESAFSGCINLTSIAFLGLAAPTTVGPAWISGTDSGIRGHAYVASNFPAPGGVFNGLTMGTIILAAPGAPTELVATAGNAQVLLEWSVPGSDGGSPVTSYNLYRSLTSGGTYALIASPSAPPYLDATLTNGQTYWYKLRAVNPIGEGDQAGPVASTPATVPTAPEHLTAVGDVNRISLSWQAPSSSGGLVLLHYEVYRGSSENTVAALIGNVTAGILTFHDTAVTSNTTYYYLVKATNAVGTSAASNVANGTTPPATVPDAPQDVVVKPGAGTVTITWQPPVSDGGTAITGYRVYRVLAGESTLLADVSASSLNYTDSTGTVGTTYAYYVVAVNTVGGGANSTQASATLQSPDNTTLYGAIGAVVVIAAIGAVVLVMRRRK